MLVQPATRSSLPTHLTSSWNLCKDKFWAPPRGPGWPLAPGQSTNQPPVLLLLSAPALSRTICTTDPRGLLSHDYGILLMQLEGQLCFKKMVLSVRKREFSKYVRCKWTELFWNFESCRVKRAMKALYNQTRFKVWHLHGSETCCSGSVTWERNSVKKHLFISPRSGSQCPWRAVLRKRSWQSEKVHVSQEKLTFDISETLKTEPIILKTKNRENCFWQCRETQVTWTRHPSKY